MIYDFLQVLVLGLVLPLLLAYALADGVFRLIDLFGGHPARTLHLK